MTLIAAQVFRKVSTWLDSLFQGLGFYVNTPLDDFLEEMIASTPPLSITAFEKLLKARPENIASQKLQPDSVKYDVRTIAAGKLFYTEPYSEEFWRINRLFTRAIEYRLKPIFVHELTVDIDGVDDDPRVPHDSMELAHAIGLDILLPLDCPMFVEVSRNRQRAYLRFRVKRESTKPGEFNTFIDQFTAYLQNRYGHKDDGNRVWIDKVGGKLAYWEENPDFDEEDYFDQPTWAPKLSNGESYAYCKQHHGETPKPAPDRHSNCTTAETVGSLNTTPA